MRTTPACAAPDEPGAGEDSATSRRAPIGTGAGGGADDENGDDQPQARPGEDGGDAGVGAEGDGANETEPDAAARAPSRYDDGRVGEEGDDDGLDDGAQRDGAGNTRGRRRRAAGWSASTAGEGAIAPVAAGAQPPGGGAAAPPLEPAADAMGSTLPTRTGRWATR